METSSRRTRTGAVCLAAIILAGFAAYGLLIILELFLAQHSTKPESLPPPGDRRMLLAVFAVALISGVLITLRWHSNRHQWSDDSVRGLSAFTAIATAAFIVGTLVTHFALEQSYLHSVPAGTASSSALLEAGHKACDWLDGRHWGRPSGPNGDYLEGVPYIGHPTLNVINSTGRLATYYHDYLSTQPPSAMTRLEDKVSLLAWYKMCPFQQWVHRPVSGRAAPGGSD
jgi:hypothetical protein